jgi:hypothetical protein
MRLVAGSSLNHVLEHIQEHIQEHILEDIPAARRA